MLRNLLLAWSARLPARIIKEGDQPYLERYYVCSFAGIRVYLHRFVGSDPDRGLHSHPWRWALSLILHGWYWEERFRGDPGQPPSVRKIRWLNFLVGESFHRVVMPRDLYLSVQNSHQRHDPYRPGRFDTLPTECWSLFIHRDGADRRWGFMRDEAAAKCFSFTPFTYPGGATRSGEWWKTAPTGRQIRENREAAVRAENALTGN